MIPTNIPIKEGKVFLQKIKGELDINMIAEKDKNYSVYLFWFLRHFSDAGNLNHDLDGLRKFLSILIIT